MSIQSAEAGAEAGFVEADIIEHVKRQIGRATVVAEPQPHIVIDDLFPASFYSRLLKEWPDRQTFERIGELRGTIKQDEATGGGILVMEFAFSDKTFPASSVDLGAWSLVRRIFNDIVPQECSRVLLGGRPMKVERELLIERKRQFDLRPHIDTLLFDATLVYYVPDDDRHAHLGTVLFRHVDGPLPDMERQIELGMDKGQWAHLIGATVEPQTMVEFLPNRLFVLANGARAWHGQTLNEDYSRRTYNVFLKEGS